MKGAAFDYYYFDPRAKDMPDEQDYTAWDLGKIMMCHILFLYIHADDPGGHNAFFEAGVAVGLGKRVIFINEKEEIDRYTRMIQVAAEFYACKLEQGIGYLKGLAALREFTKIRLD